jgi:hypothetical protein
MGRFMSPDPIGNFVADPTNPQSWNLYTYVENDPTSMVDPSGLDTVTPEPPCPPHVICVTTRAKSEPDMSAGDCMPLIFVRGDPFDAEFPNIAFEDATQSTFCGSGGDFARRYVDDGGIGGGWRRSTGAQPQAPTPISPQAQKCMASANAAVQSQLQTFAGYAGVKLLGRVAIGAAFGSAGGLGRFLKTENPWAIGTAALVGAMIGAGQNAYADSQTIQNIQNSFMGNVAACMEQPPGPPQ